MKGLKSLFRKSPPEVLQDYFRRREIELPEIFDWSASGGKLASAIDAALAAMNNEIEDDLRGELEKVQELASDEGWTAIQQVCLAQGIEMPDEGGEEGAAFFVLFDHPDLFERIGAAASMNRFHGGQQWSSYRYETSKHLQDSISDEPSRQAFVSAVLEAKNFPDSRHHEADWFAAIRRDQATGRAVNIVYLSLYLHERSTNEFTLEDGRITRALRPRIAEMIFAIDPVEQEIEISGKGGQRVHKPLAEAFGTIFVGDDAEPVRVIQRDVDFEILKRRLPLELRPEDHVTSASVVKLKFSSDGLSSLFEFPSDTSEIYPLLEHQFGSQSPHRSGALVTGATIKIKRDRSHGKTLTIDLRWPNKTTLPNQTDEDRALSYRLLERWGILAEDEPLFEAAE